MKTLNALNTLPPPKKIWGPFDFSDEYKKLQRLCDQAMIEEWRAFGSECERAFGSHIAQRIKYLEGLDHYLRPVHALGDNSFLTLYKSLDDHMHERLNGDQPASLLRSRSVNWLDDAQSTYKHFKEQVELLLSCHVTPKLAAPKPAAPIEQPTLDIGSLTSSEPTQAEPTTEVPVKADEIDDPKQTTRIQTYIAQEDKKIVIVGGDRFLQIIANLKKILPKADIQWVDTRPSGGLKQLDSVCRRMGNGTVDIVLVLRSFVSHKITNKINAAYTKDGHCEWELVTHGYGISQILAALGRVAERLERRNDLAESGRSPLPESFKSVPELPLFFGRRAFIESSIEQRHRGHSPRAAELREPQSHRQDQRRLQELTPALASVPTQPFSQKELNALNSLPEPKKIWGSFDFSNEYKRLQCLCESTFINKWHVIGSDFEHIVGLHIAQRIKYLEDLYRDWRPVYARGDNSFLTLYKNLDDHMHERLNGDQPTSLLRSLSVNWLDDAQSTYKHFKEQVEILLSFHVRPKLAAPKPAAPIYQPTLDVRSSTPNDPNQAESTVAWVEAKVDEGDDLKQTTRIQTYIAQEGKKIIIVGGDHFLQIIANLKKILPKADIQWVDTRPAGGLKKLDSVCQRMSNGTVDVILVFRNFVSHKVTDKINATYKKDGHCECEFISQGYGVSQIMAALGRVAERLERRNALAESD